MYARVPTSAHAAVSALWNGAYDLGMGVGAVAVGALAARTCYGVAFLLVAAAMLRRSRSPATRSDPTWSPTP